MRNRTILRLLGLAVAATLAVAAGVTLSAAASSGPGVGEPHLSERRILRIAQTAARGAGDPRPSLIQHSAGTRRAANRIDSGEIVPGRRWSYLIAIRGHFVFKYASPPSSARMPTGLVLTLIVDASTGKVTDVGLSDRYPAGEPNSSRLGTSPATNALSPSRASRIRTSSVILTGRPHPVRRALLRKRAPLLGRGLAG
jgi:hypothetical protein